MTPAERIPKVIGKVEWTEKGCLYRLRYCDDHTDYYIQRALSLDGHVWGNNQLITDHEAECLIAEAAVKNIVSQGLSCDVYNRPFEPRCVVLIHPVRASETGELVFEGNTPLDALADACEAVARKKDSQP